jgi:hypothetical protein
MPMELKQDFWVGWAIGAIGGNKFLKGNRLF